MKLNKQNKQQIFYLLLTILWGSLIFYLSSQPNLSSGLPFIYDFILRKLVHITAFAILAYLLASSFMKITRTYLVFVVLVAVAYALIDELHQLSVRGRSGSARDIFIDSVGVALGIYFFERQYLFSKFKKLIKNT